MKRTYVDAFFLKKNICSCSCLLSQVKSSQVILVYCFGDWEDHIARDRPFAMDGCEEVKVNCLNLGYFRIRFVRFGFSY